jgi:hypothetical protein
LNPKPTSSNAIPTSRIALFWRLKRAMFAAIAEKFVTPVAP